MYRRTNKQKISVTLNVKQGETAQFSLTRIKRQTPMLPIPLHVVVLVFFLLQNGDGMSKLGIFICMFFLRRSLLNHIAI